MRTLLLVPVLMALAACQNPDLTAYHHAAAHPVELRESQLSMALGTEVGLAATRARQFAAQRPNNGSSFVISAEPALAEAVRAAVLAAGVDQRDVSMVPPAGAPDLTRIDRFASVPGCTLPPTRLPAETLLTRLDDGFGHDNSNASLLGCSVRHNMVQMTDDPRTLVGPVMTDGRDGARAGEVYTKWTKGPPTYSNARLPSWSTSSATTGTGQ